MNNFELRCYRETYKNPHYWEGQRFKNESLRHQSWQECRQVTDQFYDELGFRCKKWRSQLNCNQYRCTTNQFMNPKQPFKWRHFQGEIILLNVRWYLSYPLSYRNLEEMMLERGLKVDHTTICRWVHTYSPEIDKRTRRYLKPTNDSWKVDETYIKVRGEWKYLYRAVDSEGNTLDFILSAKRNKIAARRFLKKALSANHTKQPRVINTDKDQAYPLAVAKLKDEKRLKKDSKLRRVKYLNNLIEQDHRRVKKIIRAGLGYQSFRTAWRTIRGIEMIQMIRKGQVENVSKGDSMSQKEFIESLFGITS